MLASIAPVRSLLVAVFTLMLGAGFLTSLISMRMQDNGASSLVIGALGTSYFVGLTLGAVRAGRLVQRVGHIRGFAAFVSLLSASTLGYAVMETPYLWILLRLVDGGCIAGVYVCLESWLNDRAEPRARGGVLAAYMIALYSGQGLGQQLLNASNTSPAMPFVIASILVSLSVLPITLTRMAGPVLTPGRSLGIRRLYAASPLGIVGAAGTGLMLGGFYALGAVYALQSGLPVAMTAWFMSAVILGGVALQWPLGQLSDRFDRRKVIVGTAAGAALAAVALALFGPAGWGLLLAALFGGTSFALYPLCVAHTNDHLAADERVAATGGLVLIYSLGAAFGPLLAAGAMSAFGSDGLFFAIGVLAVGLFVFGLWRQWAREPVPGDRQQAYQLLPRTTPTAASLDPLASPLPDDPTEQPQSRGQP